VWGALANGGEEEALVDASLEDGDSVLETLVENLAAAEAGFAGELGGRQVVMGHRAILLSGADTLLV
jgi:hypothetical protein